MQTRPIILLGLDPLSQSVAEKFIESLASPASDTNLLRSFRPREDSLHELRRLVFTLGESAKSRNMPPEPLVVCLAAGFVPEAIASLDLVKQVSSMLQTALSGSQSIAVVVLVPPLIADDDEKIRTFEFFVRLEQMAGEVPFLNIILVNALTMEAYERYKSRASETRDNNEICELLNRELLDRDLHRTIQGIGYHAIGERIKISGRKCCYSTVGCYQLVYPAGAALKHLEARFMWELFEDGFMDVGSISNQRLASIQARSDEFILRQVRSLAEQAPKALRVAGVAFAQPADSRLAGERMYAFDQELEQAFGEEALHIERILEALEGCVHRELVDFLRTSPAYLAGAKGYVESLQGGRLGGEPAETMRPSGVDLFEQAFCLEPFVHSIKELFQAHLPGILSHLEATVPFREQEESDLSWLTRSVELLGSTAQVMPQGKTSHVRFFLVSFQSMLDHPSQDPCDEPGARALARKLAVDFNQESGRLFEILVKKENERDLAETELRSSWLRRNITRRAEYAAKKREIEGLTAELEDIRKTFSAMHNLLMAQLNNAVLPYVLRTRINKKFRDDCQRTGQYFLAFVNAILQSLKDNWQQASHIPEYSSTIAATVLTPSKLQKMYQMILKNRGMDEFATLTLQFFPRQLREASGRELSYEGCHDLADHYQKGSRSLLDRIADYARELFGPIRALDILHIIELNGRSEALQYLTDKVEKTRRFLAFSPGMVPLVENRRLTTTIFSVRTAGGEGSRLASDYKHLFQPQNHFIDSRDPNVIDITCLIFGFPAFLIHALQDCRRLALARQESSPSDLWPVS